MLKTRNVFVNKR